MFAISLFYIFIQIFGIISFIFTLLIIFLNISKIIFKIFFRKNFKWCGGPDIWAVVTGSTDGIGLEYAKQLYKKGYNLLLISRNPQKLQKVKEEIQLLYGDKRYVRTLAIDFTQRSEIVYQKISDILVELDEIHVLVNNISINYPEEKPEKLTCIQNLDQFIMDIIYANIVSCSRLTSMILPRMEKNESGVIINISSICAKFPLPYLTLYSASKVFVDFFSRALRYEYKNKEIYIQSVCPGYVSTKMAHYMKPSFWVSTPENFVKNALATVGNKNGTSAVLSHKIWSFAIDSLTILSLLSGINFNMMIHAKKVRRTIKRIEIKNKINNI